MGKGLSKQQREILLIANYVNGNSYSYKFLPLVKKTLYPELWESNYWNKDRAKVKNYGSDTLVKNCARVTIARAITRLEKRGLIIIEASMEYSGDRRIYLTPSGSIMVNGILTDENINQ